MKLFAEVYMSINTLKLNGSCLKIGVSGIVLFMGHLVYSQPARSLSHWQPETLSSPQWDKDFSEFLSVDSVRYEQREVTAEQISQLQNMLMADRYRDLWPEIAVFVGEFSQSQETVPILIDYIKRDDLGSIDAIIEQAEMKGSADVFKRLERKKWAKMRCLRSIGIIGGDVAKEFLLAAVTEEGAQDLGRAWYDGEGIPTEHVLRSVRYSVLKGLVYLRDPEVNATIDTLYARMVADFENWEQSRFLSGLIDAMAYKECIRDIGLKRFLSIQDYGHSRCLSLLSPYLDRYSVHTSMPRQNRAWNWVLRKAVFVRYRLFTPLGLLLMATAAIGFRCLIKRCWASEGTNSKE
jgi:hypothetical protein